MRRRKSYSARAGAFLRTHPNRSSLIFLRLTLTALTFTLGGCDSFGEKYAAEVGYRAGEEIKWEIWGDYASLDECRNAAIARYNQSLLGRQPPRHVLGLSQEEPVWWVREPPSVKGARREGRMWARPQERRRACPRPSYSPGSDRKSVV